MSDITTRPESENDRRLREWMEQRKIKLLPAPKPTWPPKTIRRKGDDRE